MRDVRASSPSVPEDAKRQAVNRAHAEAQKKKKDAEEAKRKRKNLKREELEKRRRQQRKDGLPVEASPSPSLSVDSSGEDDESKGGGVLWTISLMLGRQRSRHRRAARRFQGEEEMAPWGRQSLTPRPKLIRSSYGHWGSVPSARWARRQWGRSNCPRRGSRGRRSLMRVG